MAGNEIGIFRSPEALIADCETVLILALNSIFGNSAEMPTRAASNAGFPNKGQAEKWRSNMCV